MSEDARDSVLRGLNKAQLSAVTHSGSPLLVLAGAGTGKTRVLVRRLAFQLLESGDAERVLAVTFTNKAASEARSRVQTVLGHRSGAADVGTFHWLGHAILRRYGTEFGRDFRVLTPAAATRLLRGLLPPGTSVDNVVEARNAISAHLNGARHPQGEDTRVRELAERYRAEKLRQHALDLDDLILETNRHLGSKPTLLERVRARYKHILVDEYQDVNASQTQLIKLLVGERGNVTAVGDDDQAIYGWRFANPTAMLEFPTVFPGATIIRLEENYRSVGRILQVGNAVLRNNVLRFGKTLYSSRVAGNRPQVLAAEDERDEARFVAGTIERLSTRQDLRKVAVLFRVNAQSRAIEEAFLRSGIPYDVLAGRRFYERPQIVRITDALAVLASPTEEMNWLRLLGHIHGIGPSRAATLAGEAQRSFELRKNLKNSGLHAGPLASIADLIDSLRTIHGESSIRETVEVLDAVFRRIGKEDVNKEAGGQPNDDLNEFVGVATDFDEHTRPTVRGQNMLAEFLSRIAMDSRGNQISPDSDSPGTVQLMSLHGSKGLEFQTVFIVGIEEGLLPHRLSTIDPASLEEERRLFYVGITRAGDSLFLSYTCSRIAGVNSGAVTRSRFLDEIPTSLLEPAVWSRTRPTTKRLPSVAVGDAVRHARWGTGTVVTITGSGRATIVEIEFGDGRPRRVQLCYAPLERIP
jgi:DNA helicase-2/ATP-dependent DNA helicase PcrA